MCRLIFSWLQILDKWAHHFIEKQPELHFVFEALKNNAQLPAAFAVGSAVRAIDHFLPRTDFFFFGQPAFICLYVFSSIVLLLFGRLVPAARRLLMFL